jgi:hypothetical protein
MNKQAFQISWALAATLPLMLLAPLQASAAEKAAEPCKAQPQEQGQPAPGDSTSDQNRVADCNGVLHPPAIGDPEMVKPAPDVGKLRIVPPDAVPQTGNNGTPNEGKTP